MSNKDRYDRQLKGLVDALGRSIIEASDEEILEDAKLAGVDLVTNAAELKQMFLTTAKTFQKRKFMQAQEAYGKEVQNLQRQSFQLPTSAADRRALLQLVVAQQGQQLTANFRDFENLSDNDVASLLEEFGALGMIPKTDSKE